MSDKISAHLTGLGRRDFLKFVVGAAIVAASFVTAGRILAAPTPVNMIGYGSGGYGRGKYGTTSNRYSIFLPVVRK